MQNYHKRKKYFTTSDSNTDFNTSDKRKKFVNESDISGFINNSDLDTKIKILVTKAEIKVGQDETVKL